mgnify:CR=1 FL=1
MFATSCCAVHHPQYFLALSPAVLAGIGWAASFDGSSRIAIPRLQNFRWANKLSVSLWFRRTDTSGYMGSISKVLRFHGVSATSDPVLSHLFCVCLSLIELVPPDVLRGDHNWPSIAAGCIHGSRRVMDLVNASAGGSLFQMHVQNAWWFSSPEARSTSPFIHDCCIFTPH